MTKAIRFVWMLVITCVLMVATSYGGEILVQTGFESDTLGDIPQEPADVWQASGGGFEVSDVAAKEGRQSLAMVGGGGDQALAAGFETQSEVVTAEFWLKVDGVERSLTVFVQDPNSGLTDWGASGPYINWIADGVRHYPGAWEDIGPFASGEWHYVRIVVDLGGSSYAAYIADTPEDTHNGDPVADDLGFRTAIAPPPGKVLFGTYGLVTPAYVDDLLIYEGDVVPEGIFAVTPQGKMAETWGEVKKQS